ncbi:MAG: response regulator [Xanthobacteraceae bacterium]|nr:response regulator [Xanthobacteraceae bacterium]
MHHVCVLDDEPDVLQSLRFLLETHGFDVSTFSAAATFLSLIEPDQTDCIVIDYKMPHMDGLDVSTRLRQRNVSTPIILITGYSDHLIEVKAATAGVNHVLLKPLLEDNLVKCVRNAVAMNSPRP